MQLEEMQRQVRVEATAGSASTSLANQLEEKRLGILSRLKVFHDLQRIYMPGSMRAIAEEDEIYRRNDMPPQPAELIKLWLPSDLDPQDRPIGCIAGLAEMEAKLREAQCHEALDNIHDRLHSKKHLIDRRNNCNLHSPMGPPGVYVNSG
ncbi:hypothetical protein PILCRDRAFT_14267 [Piloderma croceum F 1598]|uniref:Uncharacterized protein n=1 Tax=Piloderma croceum (strain F 1598) TaxID=765440 RepID=A0A0C3BBC3_PILCF|nr:hypothetical protein PILCRDRAFT_14267 [Piloderma croceum F 1598]